jgi:hypothetical protein
VNEKYTIQLKSVGDHLEVTIPELNITVETAPGKTSRDDALDVAQQEIIKYHMKLREHVVQAIKRGGSYTDGEIAAILAADEEEEE